MRVCVEGVCLYKSVCDESIMVAKHGVVGRRLEINEIIDCAEDCGSAMAREEEISRGKKR